MPAIVRCRRPPRPTEFPRPNLPHLSRPGRRRGRAGGRRCAKGPPRYTIGQGGSSRSKWAHTLAWTRSGMKWTCRSTMPGSPSEATYAATSWSRRAGGASMPPSLPADPAGASRECRPRRTCWGRQAGRAGGHRRMAASLRERWRRPPRLRTVGAEDEERHATWLELFFDLVFVICIAEVVHTLEDDRSLGGFLAIAGLWWIYFEYVGALAIRSVLDGLCFTYAHLPLLAGLVSVAVGTELAVVQAAAGELERATAAALGGGTALYLLALTAIHATTGHAIGDRVLWLRLGSAAVALAVGAFGPLGAPLGLVGLLAALLVVHVAVEMALRHQAASEAPPDVPTATGPTLP